MLTPTMSLSGLQALTMQRKSRFLMFPSWTLPFWDEKFAIVLRLEWFLVQFIWCGRYEINARYIFPFLPRPRDSKPHKWWWWWWLDINVRWKLYPSLPPSALVIPGLIKPNLPESGRLRFPHFWHFHKFIFRPYLPGGECSYLFLHIKKRN